MDDEAKEKIKVSEFLKYLKAELKSQSIRREDFCDQMPITQQTLYNWFSGKTQMKLADYYRAIEVLNVEDVFIVKLPNL